MSEKTKFRPLPGPAKYFPFTRGRYDEKPNLSRLGKNFGNGDIDGQVLQFDNLADIYRQQKLRARIKSYSRYICESMLQGSEEARSINQILIRIACTEYPEFFRKQVSKNGWQLQCLLSGDTLYFHNNDLFRGSENKSSETHVDYRSGLDALACQFQEDICAVKLEDSSDRLIAAHLCFPNRWAAAQKIGKSLIEIHQPVTRFNEANPKSASLIRAVSGKTPFVRFAWGLSNDSHLDHHPDVAEKFHFEGDGDALYVRIERQVLVGIPENKLLLFFIRTYYEDCRKLRQHPEIAEGLAATLTSMSREFLAYKDLLDSRDRIVQWLRTNV